MAKQSVYLELVVKGQQKFDAATKSVGKVEQAANKIQGTGNKFSRAFGAMGASASGAAGGVKVFGMALNSALGPIGAALAAIGGLSAAFKTIAAQDFAVAKVKTLGVNSEELVKNLRQVSNELNGSASVADLTGAAYDVASAGFADAADNAMVLKAAALGAAGGFTDMNTAGNALTSVLNAYGMSADSAEKIMDQFVQTQNDGKIVVAEYAANIGKVASAAAGLGVPLAEVNAAIAQSTAAGVNAEMAFTGVKSALARLASGEATKALEGTGLQIDAASVAADGLIGTLKKMKAAGLDTGQIFKALGTEAAPALLPLLNNLEKAEKLLENQANAAGTAAEAQKIATDTIQGAWKQLTTVFENFFTDQSVFGTLAKEVIKELAMALKGVGDILNVILAPFKALLQFALWVRDGINQLATAFGEALKNSEGFQALQAIFAKLQPALAAIGEQFMKVIAPAFETMLKWASKVADVLGKIVMVWLDQMITGMVAIGKLIPGLGGKARELEAGWKEIKNAVQETVPPTTETKEELQKAAGAADQLKQNTQLSKEEANKLKEAQQEVTKAIQEGSAALDRQFQAQESLAGLQAQLGQEKLQTERALNDVLLQQAQRQLDGARSAEEREAAAKDIYDLTVQQAKLELQSAKAAIVESLRKVEAQRDLLVLKAKEVETQVAIARAQGIATAAHEQALALAYEAVGIAEQQVMLQTQIAAEQFKQADALYEGKVAAAEAALQQNRVWQATEGAANSAATFAQNMTKAAGAANSAASAMSNASQSRSPVEGNAPGLSYLFGAAGNDPEFSRRYYQQLNELNKLRNPMSPATWTDHARRVQELNESFGSIAARYNQNQSKQQQEQEQERYNTVMGYNNGGGGAVSYMASGGYASGATAIVGEGAEGEYVIPASKMEAAMARYSAGARGDSVIPSAAEVTVNYGGSTLNMGGKGYVQQDDVNGIVSKAVSQTLSTLKRSAKARLEAGIR